MSKPGKFIEQNLNGKKLELYVGDQVDWLSYADNDTMSYVLIIATFKAYDEDNGILTLTSNTGQEFWIAEDKIEMFWEAGSKFNLLDTMSSTIRTGKTRLDGKSRDIM